MVEQMYAMYSIDIVHVLHIFWMGTLYLLPTYFLHVLVRCMDRLIQKNISISGLKKVTLSR